jgi:hypothetical protein
LRTRAEVQSHRCRTRDGDGGGWHRSCRFRIASSRFFDQARFRKEQRGIRWCGDVAGIICSVRINAMYHIIQVGMNSEALKQLDALRQAYPNLYNRQDILLQLLADAHQKFVNNAPAPKLQLVA